MHGEALQMMNPMVWIIIGSAVIISIASLFNPAITFPLKLAVIGGMLLFVIYFLVQAQVIILPPFGK